MRSGAKINLKSGPYFVLYIICKYIFHWFININIFLYVTQFHSQWTHLLCRHMWGCTAIIRWLVFFRPYISWLLLIRDTANRQLWTTVPSQCSAGALSNLVELLVIKEALIIPDSILAIKEHVKTPLYPALIRPALFTERRFITKVGYVSHDYIHTAYSSSSIYHIEYMVVSHQMDTTWNSMTSAPPWPALLYDWVALISVIKKKDCYRREGSLLSRTWLDKVITVLCRCALNKLFSVLLVIYIEVHRS